MNDKLEEVVNKMVKLGDLISDAKNEIFACKRFKVNSLGEDLISERQFQILIMLKYLQDSSLASIAKKLTISSSNLSILISKLVDQGYVKKVYPMQQEDKRKVHFYITEKGNKIVGDLTNNIEDSIVDFYNKLNHEQIKLLHDGLNHILMINPHINKELMF